MIKIQIIIILIIFSICGFSQNNAKLGQNETSARIVQNDENSLRFINIISEFSIHTKKTSSGEYSKLSVPGYFPDMNIGNPELPVMTKLIEVPYNADFEINIISYDKEVVDLKEQGYTQKIFPNQRSLFRNEDAADQKFEKNQDLYNSKTLYQPDPIQIINKSRMRGINVAQIILNPFQYDLETNTLYVLNNMEVEILFHNADMDKTQTEKTTRYSPAFESVYNTLWNYKAPTNKFSISSFPVKYVIIADRMFEETLQELIEWKTRKGFEVITGYTDEIGSSTAEIKTFVQNLYEAGTPEDPAPSYLLIVGDIEQVPSFQMSGHVSDMYYCEFDGDGDYIPEMFFGRFSATTVEQLIPQIEKTIMWEQFTFPDEDFMREAVLVAGHDNNWAPTHGNGQINYAKTYYFNTERGVIDHTYLHPESNGLATEIIADISNGVGFVNYTAHCGSTGWAGPDFTNNDIPGLQNEDKYFFSIGNCCQSNKFDNNECFGEALLRASKKGAVVHIGGSNNTMWDEDYYWSVGVSTNITANNTYQETSTAMYDHLFHENDETQYITAYQMVFIGNMQVTASTSSQKKYYWEIYHVMGDPSLMPYVGYTPEIDVEHLPSIPLGMDNFIVNTEPGAYVALNIDGVLLDATPADQFGVAELNFEPLSEIGGAEIVVTAQFRKPYINTLNIAPTDNDYDAMLISINTPNNLVHSSQANFKPEVSIMNLGLIPLQSLDITYSIDEDEPVVFNWTGNLNTFDTDNIEFPEMSLPDGTYFITAFVSNPNGEEDQYNMNDQREKTFTIYSGNVQIIDIVSPETINCNSDLILPEIIIKNDDDFPLTSLDCSLISDEHEHYMQWTGLIEPGESENILFPEFLFPSGTHSIEISISNPNGGDNLNIINTSITQEFITIGDAQTVQLNLLTDRYGDENTWELVDNDTDMVLYSGGPYPSNLEENYIYDWCLGHGCYTFTIFDSYGDGMAGFYFNPVPGHITITNLDTEEEILDLPGDQEGFTYSHSVSFCLYIASCPDDFTVNINAETIEFEGENPTDGTFEGPGVTDNTLNTEVAGEGVHEISYTILDGNQEPVSCTFFVTITENTGTENLSKISNINIWPNPSDGKLFISNNSIINNLEILNFTGQVIQKFENLTENAELDISDLPNGTYIIRIKHNEFVTNKKLVITR
jgi:hypothetical protein